MANEKEEITLSISSLRKEIVMLREKIEKLSKEKEEHYSKKKEIDNELNDIFNNIKEFKSERNRLNSEIKKEKEKRDSLKKELNDKFEEVKKIKDDVNKLKEKLKIDDPVVVEKKIRRMEFYLETQPISYSKEKQIRENIRRMKQAIMKVGKDSELWSKYMVLTKDIRDLKTKINELNFTIRDKARKAREYHNKLLSISSKIPELKEKRKKEWQDFVELKKELSRCKNEIKEKISQKLVLSQKSINQKKKIQKEKEKENKVNLIKKKEEIEEKIKKKQKLTTQDLLLFQKIEELNLKKGNNKS